MPLSDYLASLRARIGSDLLMLPSVTACVFDDEGRMLVARHTEMSNLWCPPGGIVEPDEAPGEALVRELREELGLGVRLHGLIGAYGGPTFRTTYLNGDQVAYVISVYGCTVADGHAEPDGVELAEVRWVHPAEAAALPMPPWTSVVVPDGFAWRDAALPAPAL
ncbi:NUDIX domain-containing protein [Sphaerisporangium rubeum]|uniref:8-oxo-dGTP pyrophosphatase MutT (NUDIX family) n=1 Tax=Sphaerisporangium rubeum TaxID=321317 RepID=A0A7X0IGA2_9ACTN|nr:8-oxo-dGTP pyrophosphatase MutT (NUDIX family) [Sphaerisporangium rubeum]